MNYIKRYKISHRIEFGLLRIVFKLFSLLKLKNSSRIGAVFGAILAVMPAKPNRTARHNLRLVFPELNEVEVRNLQFKSVVNFTRTMAEMPRVYSLKKDKFFKHVNINGIEHLQAHAPAIILTAHLGNWEVLLAACGHTGIPVTSVYRAANNPLVDGLICSLREKAGNQLAPKGAKGARILLKSIKDGRNIGMLNDQKMNDGIEAKFLGQPAMTAPAMAELARKYNLPIIPAFCIRRPDGKFDLTVEKPLNLQTSEDQTSDINANTQLFNDVIEDWIKKYPEQWLWAHKRFK